MKATSWLAVGVSALSFLDIVAIRLTAPAEGGQRHLPLDLSNRSNVIGLYVTVLVVVLLTWLILYRSRRGSPWSRAAHALILVAVVFLAVRGGLATAGSRAPFDRAKAARTVARLHRLDKRVQEFAQAKGRLPVDLSELAVPKDELMDEWRVTIRYVRRPGSGYRIWADGAPAGKPGLRDYYEQLTIERTTPTKASVECVGEAALTPDADWREALKLAKRGGAAARSELEKLRDRQDARPSTLLANDVLFLWKKDAGSYESPVPRPLTFRSPSKEELTRLVPGRTRSGVIVIDVDVNEHGTATHAEIVKSIGLPAVERLVCCRALAALYCPAKMGGFYRTGRVTMTCRIEGSNDD